MNELLFNGKFLAQPLTGVQRFSLEVLQELSAYENLKITVVMPKDGTIPDGDFPNCTFVKTGRFKGALWEQLSLTSYCRKKKLPLLSTGDNAVPQLYKRRSYVTVHDVIFKEKMKGAYGKLWALKCSLLVKGLSKCRAVFTVSNFSRGRLEYFYPKLKKNPPIVVTPGVGRSFEAEPQPVEGIAGEFYLAVGSINTNKNFKYILYLAKHNPDKTFVVTGKKFEGFDEFIRNENIKNCVTVGYMSTNQLIWLYKNCKGFIQPSRYEGFGLQPLEAMAVGCRNVYLSDIPVFREVYSGAATFFDPLDYQNTVKLENKIYSEEEFKRLLSHYTWSNTARIMYETIFEGGANVRNG